MVAVDTNVLVYAHRREVREHRAAIKLVAGLAEGGDRWAIPWPCLYEFISVATNPRIWKDTASSPEEASKQLDAWLGSPSLVLLSETDDFWTILRGFAVRPRVRGPIIHDARIAALCIAHGVNVLLTRDRDFSLFSELAVRDPFSA
jgi:toxin-antitoxin system PIN domain toxin